MKVIGLDDDGNYTNIGQLVLSENEVDELIATQYIEDPKQLVGRKMAVVSNAICKEAGIQHLNTTITPDEWQVLQTYINENNKNEIDGLGNSNDDILLEF